MTYHAHTLTPLGEMILASNGQALTGAWFTGQAHFPQQEDLGHRIEVSNCDVLTDAQAQLLEYFAGQRTAFELPIAPEGTDFQLAVWAALREIPYGYTTTYGAISKIMGPAPRLRPWARLWAAIRFPSLSPATGWLQRTASLPATLAGWSAKSFCSFWKSQAPRLKGGFFND